MAFTGDFVVTQNDPSTISLLDTSTGSDPNITARTITCTTFDGTTLVPTGVTTTYINWPVDSVAGDTITLNNLMSTDYALSITVQWFNFVDPDPAGTYSKTQLYNFDMYAMTFLCGLSTEDQARNPAIVNDTSFFFYKLQFYDYVIQARISVGLMNDIFKAQYNLNQAEAMRLNQTYYF